ncbi:helix-turn-helix domain-containing protein, partial [Streptococcus caprae]
QEELAEKLYVSRQTISNWERGKTYPDINSLLLIATYFDVSLDNLIKGDVEEMKHQVNQKQFKKWVIIAAISFFVFSVAYPTRYLLTGSQSYVLLSALALPVIHSLFEIFYIWRSQNFRTYADILNFLENKQTHKSNLSNEIWFTLILALGIFLIFFAGTVVSTLIFW